MKFDKEIDALTDTVIDSCIKVVSASPSIKIAVMALEHLKQSKGEE